MDLTVGELIEELKRYDPACCVHTVKSWTFNKGHKFIANRIVKVHQVEDRVVLELAGYVQRTHRKTKDPLDDL